MIEKNRNMNTRLNIGCGYTKIKDFINIDKAKEVKPDQVVDIEKGLPFKDNSFDYIYSEHCLEHVRPGKWSFVLNEIARVAKNGCVLELKLPFDNIATRTNIDHYRTFSWSSFDQFEIGNLRNYYSRLKLKRVLKKPFFIKRWIYYVFPILLSEVHLKYRIIKEPTKN